jgi:uncharacterized membrane protein
MKPIRFAIVVLILLTVALTLIAYPHLPDTVASHWNAAGEVDGYLQKTSGLALIPLLAIGLSALFVLLPRIDPLRHNYQKFQDYYDGFILVIALFLCAIQLQIILWGLGMPISPNLTMPLMMGALFIYLGFLLEHAEPNWFVGIRTPWTLSSATVWRKTHTLGGKLFKVAGLVSCAGVLFGRFALLFVLIPVIAVTVYTVVYSYLEFRKEGAT